jgi:hypothetical protein
VSQGLIVALLVIAVVAGAALSLLAWHRLGRGAKTSDKSGFDSDGADV